MLRGEKKKQNLHEKSSHQESRVQGGNPTLSRFDVEQRLRCLESIQAAIPKYTIGSVSFSFTSSDELKKTAVIQCSDPSLLGSKLHGVNSPAMGTVHQLIPCMSCAQTGIKCTGHLGYIQLACPFPHPLAREYILYVLRSICQNCGSLLLPSSDYQYIKRLTGVNRLKRISEIVSSLPSVRCQRGISRSGGTHHDHDILQPCPQRHAKYPSTDPKKPDIYQSVVIKGLASRSGDNLVGSMVSVPITRILSLFNNISHEDLDVLGFKGDSHPRNFIMSAFPVIPERNRPAVGQGSLKKHDHITRMYGDLIRRNNTLTAAIGTGEKARESVLKTLKDEIYNIIYHIMINTDGQYKIHRDEPARTISWRMTGKNGYCRFESQGKRVNRAGRAPIGPGILPYGTVVLPAAMSSITIPERVNEFNIQYIQRLIEKGRVLYITAESEFHPRDVPKGMLMKFDAFVQNRSKRGLEPFQVRYGDLIERMTEDGDDVFVNRQPSLHRYSLIAARAVFQKNLNSIKIHMGYTKALNADFDGDEINVNVPQTNRARAELRFVISGGMQIISSGRSAPIDGLVYNAPTSAYLLSTDYVTKIPINRWEIVISTLLKDDTRARTLSERLAKSGVVAERSPRALLSLCFPETFCFYRFREEKRDIQISHVESRIYAESDALLTMIDTYKEEELSRCKKKDDDGAHLLLIRKMATTLYKLTHDALRNVAQRIVISATPASCHDAIKKGLCNLVDTLLLLREEEGEVSAEFAAKRMISFVKKCEEEAHHHRLRCDGDEDRGVSFWSTVAPFAEAISIIERVVETANAVLLLFNDASLANSRLFLDALREEDDFFKKNKQEEETTQPPCGGVVSLFGRRHKEVTRCRPIIIKNGVFIDGVLDSESLNTGILHAIYMQYGGAVACRFLSEATFLLDFYLEHRGFSIGLRDILLEDRKQAAVYVHHKISETRAQVAKIMERVIQTDTERDLCEQEVLSVLGSVLSVGHDLARGGVMGETNSLGVMVKSGSKGSVDNVAQMTGCLGQQLIGGRRPEPIVSGNRTLVYFDNDKTIESRGFVSQSFCEGLSPASFFTHQCASREGLLDTSLKTADTGFINHKSEKILTNEMVCYNGAVVNLGGGFTSLSYGEGYDPSEMVLVKSETAGDVYSPIHIANVAKELELMNYLKTNAPLRKLTQAEISYIVDAVPPVKSAIAEVAKHNLAEIKDTLTLLLSEVVLRPSDIELMRVRIQNRCARAEVNPGESVGSQAAESLGEPQSQATLNTFHYSGRGASFANLGVHTYIELLNLSPVRKIRISDVHLSHLKNTSAAAPEPITFLQGLHLRRAFLSVPVCNLLKTPTSTVGLEFRVHGASDVTSDEDEDCKKWYKTHLQFLDALYKTVATCATQTISSKKRQRDFIQQHGNPFNVPIMTKIDADDINADESPLCQMIVSNDDSQLIPTSLIGIPFIRLRFDRYRLFESRITLSDVAAAISLLGGVSCVHTPVSSPRPTMDIFATESIIFYSEKKTKSSALIASALFYLQTCIAPKLLTADPTAGLDVVSSLSYKTLLAASSLKCTPSFPFVPSLAFFRQCVPIRKKLFMVIRGCTQRDTSDERKKNFIAWRVWIDDTLAVAWGIPTDAIAEWIRSVYSFFSFESFVVTPVSGNLHKPSFVDVDITFSSSNGLAKETPVALGMRAVSSASTKWEAEYKNAISANPLGKLPRVPDVVRLSEHVYLRCFQPVLPSTAKVLQKLLLHPAVDKRFTKNNNHHETASILGLETARLSIFRELYEFFAGMRVRINPKHIQLVVDVMVSVGTSGGLLNFTARGGARQQTGAYSECSFERAIVAFQKSALVGASEPVAATSTSILIGARPAFGTGVCRIAPPLRREEEEGFRAPASSAMDLIMGRGPTETLSFAGCHLDVVANEPDRLHSFSSPHAGDPSLPLTFKAMSAMLLSTSSSS
jgi:DNA-directed RNA polymerase beta' subunit